MSVVGRANFVNEDVEIGCSGTYGSKEEEEHQLWSQVPSPDNSKRFKLPKKFFFMTVMAWTIHLFLGSFGQPWRKAAVNLFLRLCRNQRSWTGKTHSGVKGRIFRRWFDVPPVFVWSAKWNHFAKLRCTRRGFSGANEWSTCIEGGSEDWDFNIYG